MQIIQERNPWEGFAQGFNKGMDNLTQGIAKGSDKRKFKEALIATNKYTPEEAELIVRSPEKLAATFMKQGTDTRNLSKYANRANGGTGSPETEATAPQTNLASSMEGLGGQKTEQTQQTQPASQARVPADYGTQLSMLAQQQRADLMNKIMGGEQGMPSRMQMLSALGQPGGMDEMLNQQMPEMDQGFGQQQPGQPPMQQPMQQPMQEPMQEPMQPPMQTPIKGFGQPQGGDGAVQPQEKQAVKPDFLESEYYGKKYEDNLAAAKMAMQDGQHDAQRHYETQADIFSRKAEAAKKREITEENKSEKLFKEISKAKDAADESMTITGEQRNQLFEGGMSKPVVAALAETLEQKYPGFGVALSSSATQIFSKLSAKRLGVAKEIAGGAIRSYNELKLIMKGFVNEVNDEKAMRANLDWTDAFDYLKQERDKSAMELYEENGGKPPQRFEYKLRQRMAAKDPMMKEKIKEMTEQLPNAAKWKKENPGKYLIDTHTGRKIIPKRGNWRYL